MAKQQAGIMHSDEMEQALRTSEYGFGDDDIIALADAEAMGDEPIENWSRQTFDEALGALKGRAAFEVVRAAKADSGVRTALTPDNMPERAPYLSYGSDGKPKDYDSRDPSQYWTDPQTGKFFRWDGQGRVHPVVKVATERASGGILLPEEASVAEAIASGAHWFHPGLRVWMSGIKKLADPSQELNDAVRVAMATRERVREQGGGPIPVGRVQPVLA